MLEKQHGFELVKESFIKEINAQAKLFRHLKTGAELLSIENDDENKVFGVAFRTPTKNSKGIPHIIEHSVLCGSRKYPLKEPFVDLLKGSLQTFLNAMTYPDKTIYPIASQNLKDFYNLADVYLDAVFFPILSKETFQQEGWHYELNSLDEPLIYKGVVFNEMKGAYSSADGLLYRYLTRLLFPDNEYREDSGGDPKEIPSLTYEEFKEFHATYYHPSNARLFFYGDAPLEGRLAKAAEYLDLFEAKEIESAISLQPVIPEHRREIHYFDPGEQDPEKQGLMCMAWLLPEVNDPLLNMALALLSYIILGTPASPLRKALIDSELGMELTGDGLESYLRQLSFQVGLKGINTANVPKIEELIISTLEKIRDEGIQKEMIEAGFNMFEFHLRENNTGSSPRGLLVMLNALTGWLHDYDPFQYLGYEKPLQFVREELEKNPKFFEELIDKYLLQNEHRVTVTMQPQQGINEKEAEEEKEKLARIRESFSEEELKKIIEETKHLQEIQETPDPPEAIAKLPTLKLSDLDKQGRTIPIELLGTENQQIIYHDLFTNGIIYFEMGFSLKPLPLELFPYLSLFTKALTDLGTEKEDYVAFAQRIRRKTGGISVATLKTTHNNGKDLVTWLIIGGKATPEQADDFLDIIRDVIMNVKFDNKDRIQKLLLKRKAAFDASLMTSGHSYALMRLKAQFSPLAWLSEQSSGISSKDFLNQLMEDVEHNWSSVLAKLERIRQILLNNTEIFVNVTLDQANWAKFEGKVRQLISDLPDEKHPMASWDFHLSRQNEAIIAPVKTNFVVKGANFYESGYKFHGAHLILPRYLRATWLWEQVRIKGGAYGASCSFNRYTGLFAFSSYRDPNIKGSLDVYDSTAQFLRNVSWTEKELTSAIIGTIGTIDSYMLPDAKGHTSLIRYLTGLSDEERQRLREEILSAKPEDFTEFIDALDAFKQNAQTVIYTSEQALQKELPNHSFTLIKAL